LPTTDLNQILSALKFASQKHFEQRRKNGVTPYINHPIEVAETLARVADVSDPAILCAALLHDTVEDTDTSEAEIKQLFGEQIASLVMECTDNKSLPKQERKRLQVEHAPHKSAGAKLIKLSDKISNVRDITENPPADWSTQRKIEYLDWSEQVVSGLRGQNKDLDSLYDRLLGEGRTRLSDEKR